MNETFFDYNSVSIEFDGKVAVNSVSFSINKGEVLALVGESGSGKSTIIKSIIGILNSDGKITEGEVVFEGENLFSKKEKEYRIIRGKKIGMIFQDSLGSFCPIRTIGNQITEAVRAHEKISKPEVKAKALELFHKLNFSEPEKLWKSYPFELSGGMNQRVGIAMAMLLDPPLLLADEPTSALDPKATDMVLEELNNMRDNLGTSIIIVTHDMSIVPRIADKILVLKDGTVMEYGKATEVLNNPKSDYTKLLCDAVPVSGRKGWNLSLK